SVVFVSCSVDPRDLHSFPTRRSSDLVLVRHPQAQCGLPPLSAEGRLLLIGEVPIEVVVAELLRPPVRLVAGVDLFRIGEALIERSEEHTSELQSRENLVCRLLLEKKN